MSTRKRDAAKAWTEAHAQEGRARALELFAAFARRGGYLDKVEEEVEAAGFPAAWQPGSLLSHALGIDDSSMRREFRELCAIAEGRKVRETVYYASFRYPTREAARAACREGQCVVAAKRTRRAS